MTSPDSSKEFRLVLLKVSDSLTEENVKRLAFLCESIAPAKREKVTTGLELFSELQGHDLLSEERVDLLVKWLDDLSLSNASQQLKQYKENHLVSDVGRHGKCLIHDDLPLRFFCVSCDIKICPECAFKSHGQDTSCDVIHLSELREEIVSRHTNLLKDLDEVVTDTQSAEELLQKAENLSSKHRVAKRKTALEEYVSMLETAEREKRAALEKLGNDELSDLNNRLEGRRQIECVKFELQNIRSSHQGSPAYETRELQRINKASKEIGEIRVRVAKQQENAKATTDYIVHPKSTLVSSAILGEYWLMSVYDRRRVTGDVSLECSLSSGRDPWRLSVKVSDHLSPVVVSPVDMWTNGRAHGLFAVGNTVYVVYPSRSSVTYLEIDGVPEGSWITSIAALSLSGTPSDAFLVSFYNSSVIKSYTLAGKEPIDYVDVSMIGSHGGVSCMAYIYKLAAIITRGREEVMLVPVGGTETSPGSLRSPSVGLLPVTVLPVGSCWLTLHMGCEADRRWKVMIYSMNGDRMEEVLSGTSSSSIDTPIGIGRWHAMGYTIFDNRKMPVAKFRLPSSVKKVPVFGFVNKHR